MEKMKVTLSFEKSISKDISIVVDALRASTTITVALNNFDEVIPCFSPEDAFKIHKKTNGILAGERNGLPIEKFDLGNSPEAIENYDLSKNKPKILILTTSNGTRVMERMNSTVLIGSFVNAQSVAKSSINLAKNHIDVVMAGRKGHFAIEDFLASGEILYNILNQLNDDFIISEKAQSALIARYNSDLVKKAFYNSYSARRLEELGYKNDIDYCFQKNITDNVAIYKEGILRLLDNL